MTAARQSDTSDALITGEELARMPDHDLCELIDGRIVPMSPINPEHGRIELNIGAALRGFVSTQNLGIVMTGEVGTFHFPGRVGVRLFASVRLNGTFIQGR